MSWKTWSMSHRNTRTYDPYRQSNQDENFNQKRHFCIGLYVAFVRFPLFIYFFCSLILTSIVYVLARVGSSCRNEDVYLSPTNGGSNFDIGEYRKNVLSQSKPHIIECSEAEEGKSQEACHLSRPKRYAAINQKGRPFCYLFECKEFA